MLGERAQPFSRLPLRAKVRRKRPHPLYKKEYQGEDVIHHELACPPNVIAFSGGREAPVRCKAQLDGPTPVSDTPPRSAQSNRLPRHETPPIRPARCPIPTRDIRR